MDSQTSTNRILDAMKKAGRYSCRLNCHLHNTGKAMDRAEYERRAFNNPVRPEDLQIMRYLAHMDYADVTLLTMAAEAFRAEKGTNGITDAVYIKQIVKKLLDIGCVHERRYVNDLNVDSKGNYLTTETTPIFYCLSGYGQRQYKDLSLSTEYLEEFIFSKSDYEVMKRLAGNYAVMKCRKDFNGSYTTAASDKVEKLGRMPIYGKFENDEHIVIFEPAFFNYNPNTVREDDFRKLLSLRAQFIKRVFDIKGGSKKKSLVLLIESREHLKEAVKAYAEVEKAVDRMYATSEFALGTIAVQDHTTADAFLKVSDADNEYISVVAEKPIFY